MTVHLRFADAVTKKPTPVRVCVSTADGTCFAPLGFSAYLPTGVGEAVGSGVKLGADSWFSLDGGCEMPLPAGVPLRVRAMKGLDAEPLDTTVELKPGQLTARFELAPRPRSEGWFALDGRCHEIPPHAASLEAAAEGLDAVNLLARTRAILSSDGNTYPTAHHLSAFGGETPVLDRVFVNTLNSHPVLGRVALTSHRPVFPLAFGGADGTDDWSVCDWCDQAHRKGGLAVWVDAFRGEEPVPGGEVLAAAILGKIDAIEVSAAARSQPLLPWVYRLWNAGVPVPLVGASGKESNRKPLGAMRTYCQGYVASWAVALRTEPSFVTNGPWLTWSVDGNRIRAAATSPTPFEKLEIVANGSVIATAAGGTTAELTFEYAPTETSWVAARAVGGPAFLDPSQTGFAHTSPQILSVAGKSLPRRRAYLPLLRQALERTRDWVEEFGRFETPKAKAHLVANIVSALEKLVPDSV